MWSVNVLPKINLEDGKGVFGFLSCSTLRSDGWYGERQVSLLTVYYKMKSTYIDIWQTDDLPRHGIPLHCRRRGRLASLCSKRCGSDGGSQECLSGRKERRIQRAESGMHDGMKDWVQDEGSDTRVLVDGVHRRHDSWDWMNALLVRPKPGPIRNQERSVRHG